MNDQATLLKWAQQLPAPASGRQACAKLLEAVSQQRLALPAIHQAGLLQPLCAALRSKDPAVPQRSVAVLLEASRCGPGGELPLAAAPGCCQALLDLLAAHATLTSSVFAAAEPPQHQPKQQQQQQQQSQQQGSEAAGGRASGAAAAAATAPDPAVPSGQKGTAGGAAATAAGWVSEPGAAAAWEDPQAAVHAACLLLWRVSSDAEARELLRGGTSALVPVLMALLGTPSALLRMAVSGALHNLSQAPRVQAQLISRAQELLPILLGLMGRAGPDLRAALEGDSTAAATSDTSSRHQHHHHSGLMAAAAAFAAASSLPGPTAPPPGPGGSSQQQPQQPQQQPHAGRSTTSARRQPSSNLGAASPAAGGSAPQVQQQLQPQPHLQLQALLQQAGQVGPPRSETRSGGGAPSGGGGGGNTGGGGGGGSRSPLSPSYGSSPTVPAMSEVTAAEAVALTLVHVAGLLCVLCCHPSAAAVLALPEGQPLLRRLLRSLAAAGCVAVAHMAPGKAASSHSPPRLHPQQQQGGQQPGGQQQQQQQRQQPLVDALTRFQLLCGGVVAALAGHAPLAAAAGAAAGGKAAGTAAPSAAAAAGVPIAIMSALYGYCREADAAGLIVVAANPGVAAALALALQYGTRALGADVSLAFPHPHAQVGPGGGGGGGGGGTAGSDSSQKGGTAGTSSSGGGGGGDNVTTDGGGGSAPLDPAAALAAASFALHAVRLMACNAPATEVLMAGDCGALQCLRTLTYFLIERSIQQTLSLDEQSLAVQALACGTLARLAEQPAARATAVVREALSPPLEVLSALAVLLLLPAAAETEAPQGACVGASEAALTASRSFVASLLAAIAQYGPYTYEMFTQVIVNTRGALGTLISLIPAPAPPSAPAAAAAASLPASRADRDRTERTDISASSLPPPFSFPTSSDAACGGGGGSSTPASTSLPGAPLPRSDSATLPTTTTALAPATSSASVSSGSCSRHGRRVGAVWRGGSRA
ncbi:hypothetical protein Agub_g1569 [Astrephomene gubernaculifera]|uniref:Uncharacterized protein n=1 Tax=Astrephomene gubernaculifera TaxID=47775 RepID=A0AAD3DGN1_9CHLO|nr:hypothetical protein Agub_g1569 [Astrephomene gubernaculifera]